jgi:Uma2 family endonuclease
MITKFSDLDLNKSYTYGDYLLWQFEEKVELIKGKIFKMSPAPSRKHQDVAMNMTLAIGNFFREEPCKVYPALFDVRFISESEDIKKATTTLQPDLCIICDLDKLDKKGCVGAPDLVVEILSKQNDVRDLKDKFEVYEEFGVREYWIVNPINESVLIYVLNEFGKYIGLKPFVETEIQSTIFPQFSITTEDIFRE